jgi:NADH-quinone oxidoreductase subunit N
MSYLELLYLAMPETIVVITALVVLFVDLGFMRARTLPVRLNLATAISAIGAALAIIWMMAMPGVGEMLDGAIGVNALTQLVKIAILVLAIFTAFMTRDTAFTTHVGEYFVLLLLATVGMMFLVSAENLLMIFVSLELTSLSLYVMTAFDKRSIHSAEAALKYFLFGGMAAAFTLFGLSLIYGLSGELQLTAIALKLSTLINDPLFYAALVMTVIGFGFKIAAVPFHLWAPDAYQGAPTPSAAFIASGSKVASLFILAKVMMIGFAGAEGSGAAGAFVAGWIPLLAVIAAVSLLLGNLAALAQTNIKRLLAYSAIAHAGYVLLGLLGNSEMGVASVVYYAITYGLTVVGAFAIVALVERSGDEATLASFAGLSKRAPLLSICMLVFMLSLAGIPPLAGFFGKFYLFTAAIASDPRNLGLFWLVLFAIAMSAVSLYYYLKVLKQIYVVKSAEDAPAIIGAGLSQAAIAVLAIAVIVLGAAPNLLVGRLVAAIQGAGF